MNAEIPKNILIPGYGEMGHAMEYLFAARHQVSIYDPFIEDLPTIDLNEQAASADFVIFSTPTAAIYPLASTLAPLLQPDCICLSFSKALDNEGRTAAEAMRDGLHSNAHIGVLYGPMISEEIRLDKPAFANLASSDHYSQMQVLKLAAETRLKLLAHDDLSGMSWCAVLKNVYAILFGIADGLNLGDNVRGYLAVATLHEMAEIMKKKDGHPETPYTLAGLGDLITTATSKNSHHHELGNQVAHQQRDNLHGEGINTLQTLRNLNLLSTAQYPLLHCAEKIMLDNAEPECLLSFL